MFVKSIRLLNIRSFNDTELEFSKAINLLVGNNNSGKSTIIKSLFKLQNLNTLGEDDIRKSSDFGRIYIDIEEISIHEGKTFTLNDKEKKIKFPETNRVKVLFSIYTSLIDTKKGKESLLVDNNLKYLTDTTGKLTLFDNADKEIDFLEFPGLPNVETHNNFIYPFFAKRKTNYYSRSMGTKDTFYVSEDLSNITSKIQKISKHMMMTFSNLHKSRLKRLKQC